MDRRENLKVLFSGAVATGILLSTGCNQNEVVSAETTASTFEYGRLPEEMEVDRNLNAKIFFTENEREVVSILSDIIIPKDEKSGSATEAGVPDFIEFMMKDYPKFQTQMRGGIMWLENLCLQEYNSIFKEISAENRIKLIDKIAFPDLAEPEMKYGVKFFNLMRNLTCTGFFTSKMGIKDLGYEGNRPNQWDGVPDDVLTKFDLSYDKRTLDVCLKTEDQQKIAKWNESGDLIG